MSPPIRFLRFIGHQVNGAYGVPILARFLAIPIVILVSIANDSPARSDLVPDGPYFPLQVLFALCLGWALGLILEHRAMRWVWLLPTLLLGYTLIADFSVNGSPAFAPKPDQTVWSRYFGSGCEPIATCIEQGAVTMPFYCAVFYSLGAFLAGKTSRWRSRKVASGAIIALGLTLLFPFVLMIVLFAWTVFLDSQQLANSFGNQWRDIRSFWWGPFATVLELSFPALMGGFLVRSAVKLRRQVPDTQSLPEL